VRFPTALPIAALPIVPAMALAVAIVHIIAAAGIIEAIIPAAIKAGAVIASRTVAVIIAAAIIAGAHAHPAIIAVIIGATTQRKRTGQTQRSQKPVSSRHRLSPSNLLYAFLLTRSG
jgi:hypothetical protein